MRNCVEMMTSPANVRITRVVAVVFLAYGLFVSSGSAQQTGGTQVYISTSQKVNCSTLPRTIQLSFTLSSSLILLNLQINNNIGINVPIVTNNVDGSLSSASVVQTNLSAYYFDPVNKASIRLILIISPTGSCSNSWSGTFQLGAVEYELKPVTIDASSRRRRRRQSDNTHLVSPLSEPALNYTNPSSLPVPASNQTIPFLALSDSIGSGINVNTTKPYMIEVLVIVDYRLYSRWYNLSTKLTPADKQADAISQIKYYFAHIMNGVDTRYRSINDSSYSAGVRLIGYYIAVTASGSSYMENNRITPGSDPSQAYINAPRALNALAMWLQANSANLPPHDQATLFTSDNMNGQTNNRISGLSFYMSACTQYSISLVRDLGQYSSSETAAHEMGHNLGAGHDGIDNTCSAKSQFIMVASPSTLTDAIMKNTFTFSPCSQNEIKSYLGSTLALSQIACLLTDGNPMLPPSNLGTVLPGQWYTPDQQCQIMYGSGSYYCGGLTLDSVICRSMQCYHPVWQYCVTTYNQVAFVGTSCGNNMWCQGNVCTYNASAPAGKSSCIYGDYKGPNTNGITCPAVMSSPWLCYQAAVADSCCASCGTIQNNMAQIPGCKYGDQDGSCSDPNLNCGNAGTKTRCCQTCSQIPIQVAPATSTSTTTSTTTPIPTSTSTTTTPTTTRTSTSTTTPTTTSTTTPKTTTSTTTTTVPPIDPDCTNDANWCVYVFLSDCEYFDGYCCQRCTQLRNAAGILPKKKKVPTATLR